jgi:hypothetical protein
LVWMLVMPISKVLVVNVLLHVACCTDKAALELNVNDAIDELLY